MDSLTMPFGSLFAGLGLGVLFLPLIASLVILLFRKNDKTAQIFNIGVHVLWILLLCLFGWHYNFSPRSEIVQVFFEVQSFQALNSYFQLAIDNIAFPLIALNILLSFSLSLYSFGKKKLGATYWAFFQLLNFASIGTLLASEVITFYIFWELMLIPLFFLIGKWGSSNRVYAAFKFFAMTLLGSLFLLFSILILAKNSGADSLRFADLFVAMKALRNMGAFEWGNLESLAFLGFIIAFFVKIPVWPLHTWLPDAHTEAPTGTSVILAGVLLKLGCFGIARWCLPLFPAAAVSASNVIIILGILGVILGSFGALRQSDIKRTIAYSSVAHLGFIVIGLFSFKAAAVNGALFQNLAHGLSTGLMFLIFGMVYDRTHTRELSNYGGLAKTNPYLSTAFFIAVMAGIGLPGLPGFIGEFLILSGTFIRNPLFALLALSGVLWGAIYSLRMLRGFVFGSPSQLLEKYKINLSAYEVAAIVPLLLLLFVLGMQPQFLLNLGEYFAQGVDAMAIPKALAR